MSIRCALLTLLCLTPLLTQSRARADVPKGHPADLDDIYGTWWRGGKNPAAVTKQCPWLKGVFVGLRWSRLEPADGKFDWDYFDSTMNEYANAGLYIQFMVWVGPDSPRWIYDAGVPEVKTSVTLNPHGKPHKETYPFYLEPKYKEYYHRMIRAVADRIDKLPPATRQKIVCLQTAEGSTGDEGGYKGQPLDKHYDLPEEKWQAFKFETWKLFDQLYRDKQPKIYLLINSGNQGQYDDWLNKNIPGIWRKAGNIGHGYALNNEVTMFDFLDPLINHRDKNGYISRARSEMDETFKGWFKEATVWNQYWLNLWNLTFGIDILQHETEPLLDPHNAEGFAFYSKYGGRKDPEKSPGAWIALRDGLDASDFKRFPADKFGKGTLNPKEEAGIKESEQRMVNIAKAFADRGAMQEDPDKGIKIIMQNRDAKAMNDVAWNAWRGNYGRYMMQIDPDATSIGWWRIGPKDQPYGRFARGLDIKNGKDKMYFDVADAFLAGKSLDAAYPVKVRVVYFDEGKGAWSLHYDAKDAPDKVALTVQKTGAGKWKETTVTLADAMFANRGEKKADLILAGDGKEDTIFHMIEVTR